MARSAHKSVPVPFLHDQFHVLECQPWTTGFRYVGSHGPQQYGGNDMGDGKHKESVLSK